ncbi:MAG: IS110 family transposase [Chloroflexi bacterium]|nr:IS110 family transposase [Chloroflexota bacterium]MCI0725300.1 IS110 family transposase [Chloroflexota bacterium]
MKQKRRTHLRGQRGQAFADQIRGVVPEQILCVSIDVSKDFHVVLLHNGLGEIVTPCLVIDIFRSGLAQFSQAVAAAVATIQAQVVLVGLEPTSHYYENLARHIQATGQAVTLINSFAVKENRRQQMMAHEKDDAIDAAAFGDLLPRGEGSPFRPATCLYLQLQQLERARLGEVKLQTMYKNRVIGHLDRIFPGLVLTKTAAKERYQPLFVTDFWQCQTLQDLVRLCPDPRQLAVNSPMALVALFHDQGCQLGPITAHRLIAYAQQVL